MIRRLGHPSMTAALLVCACAGAAEVDFNRDVRPILSDKCFACHGPDSAGRATELRLDVEDSAKGDLGGYRAVDVASPDDSELLLRIESDDEYTRMPPADGHKELSPEEKQTLRAWVEAGAPWSLPWAYVKPVWSDPPAVAEADWPANWVDPFVLARLEEKGLDHAPDADPRTLARRVAFDLTGLPPTTEQVERLVADPSPAAYERLVDELLASPAFGERMAAYWLDLVRYADTVGYHGDQDQNAWPYRDYVVDAFNSGKPFDEFTAEQLAGDLLPDSDVDDKIASAYNRLLQTSHEGGLQQKEYRAIYLADRVRNVSLVWMGATMGCCQCHDHKFDPLPTDEFYSLGAFFADLDDEDHIRNTAGPRLNALPTRRDPELPVRGVYQRRRLERLDAALAALDPQQDAELLESLRKQRRRAARETRLMVSKAIEPRTVRVQDRGDWQDESGPVVQPKAPEALGWDPSREGRATRLDLARWLTDGADGAGLLTARVMANRFWYLMFGEGLAPVLDDFGGQGQPPSHPRLLDNLAVEFVRSGWDVKHVMKLLATSRAYRQSSAAGEELLKLDPDNRLVARQGRYRLPAEMVRDAALSASGLLNREIGGPSAKPYQPAGYFKNLNFPQREYHAHKDRRQWRRGLYVHWQRQYLHPMLKAFDAPTREECTARRPRSSTPLSSLVLLNDPTFVEAARALAAQVTNELSGDAERIDALFQHALQRSPDAYETEQVQQLVATQRTAYESDPEAAKKLLSVGLAPVPEGADPVELAAWTAASRAVLNLGEMYARN